jgi:hypothetical protein
MAVSCAGCGQRWRDDQICLCTCAAPADEAWAATAVAVASRVSGLRYGIEAGGGTLSYRGMADLHEDTPAGEYTWGWRCGHLHSEAHEAVACARRETAELTRG